jgi:hypothetical protein
MQRFEVEDQIKLADVLEGGVEGLHEDLNEVKQREGRLGRGGDYDEIKGGVVAVGHEGWGVIMRGARGGRFGVASQERR